MKLFSRNLEILAPCCDVIKMTQICVPCTTGGINIKIRNFNDFGSKQNFLMEKFLNSETSILAVMSLFHLHVMYELEPFLTNFKVGHPPLYVTFSVRPSITQRISGTDHFWYTCVNWWYLQAFFIYFFKILIFRAVKRAKIGPKWQNVMSVSLCISGTIHHMIFGTHV